MKYAILLNILDAICKEAPDAFKSYKPLPSDIEKLNQARSKAFIHLYLKVKCGLTSFKERHTFITEGSYDGGVDAYYIDTESKKLYLIQSKFRTTQNNFEEKSITADELVRMEVRRILKGEKTDTNDNTFNDKIIKFQKQWSEIRDQAKYDIKVIILGNLKKYNREQITRLIDNSYFEVFDYLRSYDELVFPLCSGSYYDPKEINIEMNLYGKTEPVLKQTIKTKYGDYDVRILFVPISEIGRILSKYKNSILQHNPRNFLSLSKNPVNKKIRESVLETETNEFALLNNGITMIGSFFQFTEATGKAGRGQIIVTHPEIINGGQTAYVMSKIFETNNKSVFGKKEVLLRVIVIDDNDENANSQFLEQISNSTNQQSKVDEADRRSNDPIQYDLQKLIYENYGYFYERKRGEFYDGAQEKYLKKDLIVDRVNFAKAYLALNGNASLARRSSDKLFEAETFKELFGNYKVDFPKMFFSYFLLKSLTKASRSRNSKWGSVGLRYRKMAVISAIGVVGFDIKNTLGEIEKEIEKCMRNIEKKWGRFEKWAKGQKDNADFIEKGALNYDYYYKGKTVNSDIKTYFKKYARKKK